MKNLTQFKLEFQKNFPILGEFEGNDKSGEVIIFSHGFGMNRNSRGFFTQIGNSLKKDFLVVRFDYCQMISEKNATLVYSFADQAKMLQQVVKYIKLKFRPKKLNIIAHSMGCLVAGIADLSGVNKIILLCSPPSKQFRNMQDYFSHKPGTEFNLEGISKVKRSDGSWTFIDSSFWPDVGVVDPRKLTKKMANKFKIYFIRALQDKVITNESYQKIKSIKKLHFIELPGDHNFMGKDRRLLVSTVSKIMHDE